MRGRSFIKRGNRRGGGFAGKDEEPGLRYVEQEMPRYQETQKSQAQLHESKSHRAACTTNMKLGILISHSYSYKPFTPLRPMPLGYTALSPVPILSWLLFLTQGRLQTLDPSLFSTQLILDCPDGESLLHAALIVLGFLISTFFSSVLAALYALSPPGTAPPLKSLIKNTPNQNVLPS